MIIQVEFWHWWVLALCFVVIEGMVPAGVFMSMGVAGGILGGIIYQYPNVDISVQLGIFGSITMALTLIIARYKRKQYVEELKSGSIPAEFMLGKEFELKLPLKHGFGEIELDGQHWSLKGPDADRGTLVKVLKLDGDMLLVYPSAMVETKPATEEESKPD